MTHPKTKPTPQIRAINAVLGSLYAQELAKYRWEVHCWMAPDRDWRAELVGGSKAENRRKALVSARDRLRATFPDPDIYTQVWQLCQYLVDQEASPRWRYLRRIQNNRAAWKLGRLTGKPSYGHFRRCPLWMDRRGQWDLRAFWEYLELDTEDLPSRFPKNPLDDIS